ncbi:MAG: TIGR00730 family Rossman fold protein [Planctomycetota bacterium]
MRTFRRICVYCGSKPGEQPVYGEMAAALGRYLAERQIGLVFGGGHVGLMGIVADAALAAGGEVIGVIPVSLEKKELAHPRVPTMHVVESMHQRKQLMADLADGFLALPGGIGTLEELFETWTWLQLGFHDKPVGLLNIAGYFDELLRFLDRCRAERFLRPEHRDWLLVDTEPRALLDRMAGFSAADLGRWWTGSPPESAS